MVNFNESYLDLGIIAHEIGHAYHSSCLSNQTMINSKYPIPIAETASIFCETLINNHLLAVSQLQDRVSIFEKSLSDAGYYIVDF